jgi:hypothetical protein
MAINLKDITDAVKSYLDNKVAVRVSGISPQSGTVLGPNESFTFRVDVTNADAANGGVALNKLRCRLSVDPTVAKLKVPPTAIGSTTDGNGNPLVAGALVGTMVIDPSNPAFDLKAGESAGLTIAGVAASDPNGGSATINARVFADVNQDLLFPKQESTPPFPRPIQVIG